MKRYYITGIAGTGKSAVGAEFKKLGYEVYDIDAVESLCHWQHKETGIEAKYNTGVGKEWLEAHDWICDEEKLRELLARNPEKDTIVVGIAYNQDKFISLFNKVFLLYCSPETFIKRIGTRSDGNNFGKDKSEQEQLLEWYQDFQQRMENLGAIPINTEIPLEGVVENIRRAINH